MGDGKQSVPSIDSLTDTPETPYSWTVAAGWALVLNVVMDQREVVQQLDRRAERCCGSRISPVAAAASRATAGRIRLPRSTE